MSWRVMALETLASSEPRAITDGPFGSNLARRHYTTEGPRVIRLQNIGDGEFIDNPAHISNEHYRSLQAHQVQAGDLLVASLGEVLPRACLAPDWLGPAIVKADCIRIRLDDAVDPRWILYALQRPEARTWAEAHRHGVGRPRLGLKAIRQIPIPVPDIFEQRRILNLLEDHLSRLDAGRSEVECAAAKLAILRERTVIQALTGGAEANREDARLTDVGTADGDLSALPIGWSWSRLGDVADVVGGVTKDSKKQSDPNYVEVPYLRVANVQRGRLNLDEVTKIRVPQSKADALRLRPGDVLLNEGGDRDKLARGWVWEGQVPDCIHQNHVFRARITDPRIDPHFLSWTANTIGGRWAERNGKQSVNLASISLSMIRRMPVIVPPPGEAVRIATELRDSRSDFDRLEKSIRDGMDRALVLKKSLLTAAFSGRLTNSSDELLEQLESV